MFYFPLLLSVAVAMATAAPSSIECPTALEEQRLLSTAAVEGWAIALEPLDGGQSQRIRKVFSRPDLGAVNEAVDLRLGSPRDARPRVSLTGQMVIERNYGSGIEISNDALQALRAALVRSGLK